MKASWCLLEKGTARVVIDRLEIADGFWSRWAGLQVRSRPPQGFGLLLVPCSSIHTCFMRFAIDAVMLDRSGRVVEIRRGVRPWRAILPAHRTYAILEVACGDASEIELGQVLRLDRIAGAICEFPKSLIAWKWIDD